MVFNNIIKNIENRKFEVISGGFLGFLITILLAVVGFPFQLFVGSQYASPIDNIIPSLQGTIDLPIFKVGVLLMAVGIILGYIFYNTLRDARRNLIANKLYLGIFVAVVLGLLYYAFVIAPVNFTLWETLGISYAGGAAKAAPAVAGTAITSLGQALAGGKVFLGLGSGFGLFSIIGAALLTLFIIPGVGPWIAGIFLVILLLIGGFIGWEIFKIVTLVQNNFTLILLLGFVLFLVWLISRRNK